MTTLCGRCDVFAVVNGDEMAAEPIRFNGSLPSLVLVGREKERAILVRVMSLKTLRGFYVSQ